MTRAKTKLITTLLAVTMAFSLTACTNQDDIDNAVTPLSSQFATINLALTEMQTLDTTLDGYIDTLESKVATLETDLTAVNAALESLEENSATKTALTETKTALESEIKAIKEDIKALEEKDTKLDGKITALQTALNNALVDMEKTYATIEDCKALEEDINAKIATLQGKIDGLETSVEALNTTVNGLQQDMNEVKDSINDLQETITELEIRINCLEGKHVIDETKTISYVCTWSETAPTSTKNYTCVHCEKAIAEPISPSVWQAGDTVTYIAKDGNSYVSTVGEITDGKAVLVSDEMWSTGKTTTSQEKLLAIVEDKGARVPSSTEAVWSNIINPWLSSTLPESSGGYIGITMSIAYNSSGTFCRVVNYNGIKVYDSGMSDRYNNKNTWVGRYIWDVEFSTAE